MSVVFEWDHRKAKSNLRKHGISFDEAITVFDDPLATIFSDEDHSAEEQRQIIVGYSIADRLLLVSFAEAGKSKLRIISAREATRRERQSHEAYLSS